MQSLRHFLLAVQFFTRVPVTGRLADWVGFSPQMLNASSGYFAAVGAMVGCFSALIALAVLGALGAFGALHPTSQALGAIGTVACIAATAASIWLTGAFHEDGLADTFDALGGYISRERALSIMKDSRIGTYGAVALVLSVMLKVALLTALWVLSLKHGVWVAAFGVFAALVTAHTFSRAGVLGVMQTLPYVGDQADASGASKSKPLAQAVSAASWVIAALTCLCVALALSGAAAALARHAALLQTSNIGIFEPHVGDSWCFDAIYLIAIQLPGYLASLLVCVWVAWRMVRWLRARLGGFTGDTLGATQQLSELGVYGVWCVGAAWR